MVVVTIMIMSPDQAGKSQVGGDKDGHWQDHPDKCVFDNLFRNDKNLPQSWINVSMVDDSVLCNL